MMPSRSLDNPAVGVGQVRLEALAEAALRVVFPLLIAAALLLPSGSILGFNVKVWLVTSMAALVALHAILRSSLNRNWAIVALLLVGTLLWGTTVSVSRGVPDGEAIRSQGVALLAVFSVVMILTYGVIHGVVSRERALRQVVIVTVIYALGKVTLEAFMLSRVWSLEQVWAAVRVVFGVGFIRLDTGTLLRINFPTDLLLPILCMHLLAGWGGRQGRGSLHGAWRWVGAGCILASIVIAYSRFLWFATAVVLLYWLLITAARPRAWHLAWLAGLVIVILLAWPWMLERFGGQAAAISDTARREMFGVIVERIGQHPVAGSGLGYYLEQLIRIPTSPWYYEFQWLALWMQFGLVGLAVMTAVASSLFRNIRWTTGSVGVGLSYGLWLASGFVNGFFLTSSAGVVFFTYWLMVGNDGS